MLGEQRRAGVLDELVGVRADLARVLELDGERLDAVERGGHLRFVRAEQHALGEDIGDDLQAFHARRAEHHRRTAHALAGAGLDAYVDFLGLGRRARAGHDRPQRLEERLLARGIYGEEHHCAVAEQDRDAAALERYRARAVGEALLGLPAAQVDAVADEDGAGAEGGAGEDAHGTQRKNVIPANAGIQ
ncbi:MAG: hypothetical protein M5U08_19390 [Burkholderiales bacterium]|nr:hypothetical protein [Burkholderiales bacterium]